MPDQIASLDGGGTKTAVAMADRRGNVHFLEDFGGCNPQDNPDWAAVLTDAMEQVLARCRMPAHVVLGLPGLGEVPDHDIEMRALVASVLPTHATVLNDVAVAHHGAFAGAEGVLILAGTGSMAMAHGPNGFIRIGGWGDLLGDEGSAFWIGRRALILAARTLDGRSNDREFAAGLLREMGLDSATDSFVPLNWLTAQPHARSAIASVSRHVNALANKGDAVARAILLRAAAHLVWDGQTAAAKAGLASAFDWCSAGSVFRSRTVADAVADGLGRPARTPQLNALGGGLFMAATNAGWTPDKAWIARVGGATRAWAG